MMKLIVFSLILLLSSYVAAQTGPRPEVGQQAKEIYLEKILNYKDGSTLSVEEFRNRKIVILEFWATWCAPCIPAMKHLEKLQADFKNSLMVIPITMESPDKIEQYLQKSKIQLPIGIDADSSCFETYSVQTIPHSVVIDRQGVIVGITTPSEITNGKIDTLLKGGKVSFKEKRYIDESTVEKENSEITPDVLFYVKFRKSAENEPQFAQMPQDKNRITLSYFTLPMLLQVAYQLNSQNRVILDVKDPSKYEFRNAEKYYFDLQVPEFQKDRKYEIMIQTLKNALPLKFHLEKRRMKVKILKKTEHNHLQPSKAEKTTYEFRGPELTAINIPMERFIFYLENFSKYPVVDETGLTEKYDIHFKWQMAERDSFFRELERLGFKIETGERDVEVLVIKDE